MPSYEFTVTLDRVPVDTDYDRIFEAGLDDTTPGVENGRGILDVVRDSPSLSEAIVSVAGDASRAGFTVVGVAENDLVSLKTIAHRLDRSYESVRLLALGKRGSGGFPAPLSGDGWSLYSWASVADWFSRVHGTKNTVSDDDRVIAAAGYFLRARDLIDGISLAALTPLLSRTTPLITEGRKAE